MRTILKLAAALGLAACLGTTANAQGGRGMGMMGGGGLSLLSNKSVQKELKLTDEQIEKAGKAAREQNEKMAEKRQELGDLDPAERREKSMAMMKEMTAEGKKITDAMLKPEQAKRLDQITLQQQGYMAYSDAEIQKKLSLTDEQKSKVKDMGEEAMKMMADARESAGNDRAAMMEKMTAVRTELTKKAADMLTDDQKKMWKEMVGEPFTMVREPRPGGAN